MRITHSKYLLLSLLLIYSSISIAQGTSICNDETIMAVKGNWKRIEDVSHRPGNTAKASCIDAISKLFQEAYPNPMGMQALWYRVYSSRLFTDGGPDAYSFYSLYKAWHCNKTTNELFPGSATGTWAYVFVNFFSWFLSDQYDKLDFTIDGRNVYRLPKVKGEWKGYPLYKLSSDDLSPFNCIIIIRPGNELPWRPVTQKNYLDERRKILVAQRQASRDFARKTDSFYNKSIENVKKNTFLKEEEKAKMITNFENARDKNLSIIIADSARQIQYWQKKIDVIDNYIAKTDAATLKQPAVIKNTFEFNGVFETQAEGGIELVTANPNYFKKNLAPEVPQMMVLYWKWEKGPPARDFKRHIDEDFPIEKLQAMIDK